MDLTGVNWMALDIKKPEHLGFKGYSGLYWFLTNLVVVRMGGLEPPRPKSPAPQAGASTNSATSAYLLIEDN